MSFLSFAPKILDTMTLTLTDKALALPRGAIPAKAYGNADSPDLKIDSRIGNDSFPVPDEASALYG